MTLLPPVRVAGHGVQATQAGHGVQATQAGHGVQATQAGHGVQATQAGPARLPLPVPEPVRERRPLRLVPEPAALRARRLSRLFTGLAAIAVCFGLFGVVGVHVMLAQGQGEVARLSAEVEQQEAEQQRLGLQVAQLESPARVTAAAKELGMVTPSTVVALAPASLADPPPTTIPSPRATTTTTVASTSTSTGSSVPRP